MKVKAFIVAWLWGAALLLGAEPKFRPLEAGQWKALEMCATPALTLVTSSDGLPETRQYAYAIYKAKCPEGEKYVFISDGVIDWVGGEPASAAEIRSAFAKRFEGIANDLTHGRKRPDMVLANARAAAELGSERLPAIYAGYARQLAATVAAAVRPAGAPVAASVVAEFTAEEKAIIAEARTILASPEMAKLKAAAAEGRGISIKVGRRVIQYEPGLNASGMTMFGEDGFLIGNQAFKVPDELEQTVLHELYRLVTSQSASGVTRELATNETAAAADFARRALGAVKGQP